MSVEPVAYSLLALDKTRGRINEDITKHKSVITQRYINPSKVLVGKILENPSIANDELICKVANITTDDLAKAREIEKSKSSSQDMMAMMMSGGMGNRQEAQQKTQEKKEKSIERKSNPHGAMTEAMKAMGKDLDKDQAMAMAKTMGASPEAIEKMRKAMQEGGNSQPDMESMKKMISSGNRPAKKEYSKEEINLANAIMEIERTLNNISGYKTALSVSPQAELNSMTNAMNGGYTAPSPGGDPIVNPNTLPTGRNLYSINAEATPSESAWEKGIHLANKTIEMYKRRHNDSIPRKVSYTLWSGEFIETEGATIAQILYMLGVEPIRDAFGRVSDLRLIPSEELGRPRIDVVVQTSGQLRDIAASRLFLINRAVEMAATATNDEFVKMVNMGVIEAERTLIEKGLTPKDAREIATFRVFGGANGGYGTGIQGMVMAGDRWENEKEIAEVYINNMGAYYGNEKNWEMFRQFAFEAALTRTDAVIQPRQSNTWGALSLDHVFEFMGGLNLAVRNVTGKDPDAYLSDYRNRNNVRMQEVKESIGIESRTTIFNPTYISEKMKGEAGSANVFAEIVQNTYGWNVMKPSAIDNEMWDEIYNVYVKDKFKLNMHEYFGKQNPAALEEITAVMMESARKGIWRASDQQLSDIAALHTQFVNDYKPSCSGFVCDNAKLRQFIASKTDIKTAERYSKNIRDIREAVTAGSKKSMVMKKEELNGSSPEQTNNLSTIIVVFVVLISVSLLILLVRNRKKQQQ